MTQARPLVQGVSGYLVTPQWAASVVSPLHDVHTETERHAILANNPDSYLHVASDPRAPEPPSDVAVGSVQSRALRRLLRLGAYRRVPEPSLFVYRMSHLGRRHTGVVAGVAVAGFTDGRVLGHEAVQPDRVAGLVRHYQSVPMRSELVALFHPVDPVVAELTAHVLEQPPLLSFSDSTGVAHSVWQAAPAEAAALTRQLSAQRLYIADGHHRVAAAVRCWEREGRPPTRAVLCSLYPQDHVVLHAFHRRVRGPLALPTLLQGLDMRFEIAPGAGPGVAPGRIGVYAAGRWYVLRPREPQRVPGAAGLDVTVLDEHVLRPLLGIDPGDPRLEFIPDVRDLGATTRECDRDGGALFTLPVPTIEDVVSVAERHEVMSAKTTYVEPKPHLGVFLS